MGGSGSLSGVFVFPFVVAVPLEFAVNPFFLGLNPSVEKFVLVPFIGDRKSSLTPANTWEYAVERPDHIPSFCSPAALLNDPPFELKEKNVSSSLPYLGISSSNVVPNRLCCGFSRFGDFTPSALYASSLRCRLCARDDE
jgi:hypothetical protein